MNRRTFITSACVTWCVAARPAWAQGDPLDALLATVAADPAGVEDAWLYREPTVTRGIGHGMPSNRKLSTTATDLIIAFEVASPVVYESRYRRPIWPKGQSGVTIGVGYDLRFANRAFIDRDWPMLSAADRALLFRVAQLGGTRARDALPLVQSVDVPWSAARAQFDAFLPYPTHETEAAFANTAALPDDSFGALVSLVYNRGNKIVAHSDRRREMFEIRELMTARDYGAIPDRIRSMKRLWQTPDSRGLLRRREAEALLFERGLRTA